MILRFGKTPEDDLPKIMRELKKIQESMELSNRQIMEELDWIKKNVGKEVMKEYFGGHTSISGLD
jgi:hypothetical protein